MDAQQAYILALKKALQNTVTGIESITEKSYDANTGNGVLTFKYKDSTGATKTTDYNIRNGKNGQTITKAEIVGDDIVFTLSDNTKTTITGGKIAIRGEQGIQGIQGVKGDKGDKGDIGLTPKAEWDGTKLGFDGGTKTDLKGAKGDKIKHEWDGTKLKLENIDGTFDIAIDLLGASANPRGNYSNSSSYQKLDMVNYLNRVFIAKKDGIIGIAPPNDTIDNDSWMYNFSSSIIDTTGIFDNNDLNSTSKGLTSSKIKEIVDTKAEKVNVLQTNVDNAIFTPTKDNDPVTKKYCDTVSNIDNIKDSTNKVVMLKAERDKLANLQNTALAPRQTLEVLKQEYPEGKDTPAEGTLCYVVDSKGDNTNIGSYFSYTLKAWKNLNSGSLDMETFKRIYDPNSVSKDIFAMENHVESADVKHFTLAEQQKLKDLGVHKMDGFEIDATNRGDKKLLVLNGITNKHEYKDFIDIKEVGAFTGTSITRISWLTNPTYNTKYIYSFWDETLQKQFLYHRPSQAFFEYEGQRIGEGIFPNNPTDGIIFDGVEVSYYWNESIKAWAIKNNKRYENTVIRITWADYKVWVSNNQFGTGIFFILETGQIISYYNGTGVEITQGGYSSLRPTNTQDKTKLFIDTNEKKVFQWNQEHLYWEVVVNEYVEVLSANNGQSLETRFNLSDSSSEYDTLIFKYVESENAMQVNCGTTRERQYFKSVLNAKNENSVLQKNSGFCNSSTTLGLPVIRVDGIDGELMITSEKSKGTGMGFRFNFVKLKNNIFITSKQVVDMEKLADLPITGSFTSLVERKAKTLKTPVFMREFWDIDMQKMIILNSQGIWRDYNDAYENVTFPTTPTNNQVFTSTLGYKYTYDLLNDYWKLDKNIYIDDFTSALCLKNYTFRYNNFTTPNLVQTAKYFYGANLKSVNSETLLEGIESNSPIWQGNGKWKFPKGLWRMSYFWSNLDSPDGSIDWNHTATISKNNNIINNIYFAKSTSVGGMDAMFGMNTEFRSNGNDIVGFDTIMYMLYANSDSNQLTVQFEKLM